MSAQQAAEQCRHGWEALRSDPLPWLLDEGHPSAAWQTLVEIVGRPSDSPAVARARSRANASPPISNLLKNLNPDGSWSQAERLWSSSGGGAWRLVAATQLGADPTDPRLQAAAERLLAEAEGEGGFVTESAGICDALSTARILAALAQLGCRSHPRFVEALAWIEEIAVDRLSGTGGSPLDPQNPDAEPVVAAAMAQTLTAAELLGTRTILGNWARERLSDFVSAPPPTPRVSLLPCLLTTDHPEALWSLVSAGWIPLPSANPALRHLQKAQDGQARWSVTDSPHTAFGLQDESGLAASQSSPWLTVRMVKTLLGSAVSCKLPRVFPNKP